MQPRIDTNLGNPRRAGCLGAFGLHRFGQPEPWLLARLAELNGESTEPFAAGEFGGTVDRPAGG